ncbi:protein-export membrane protein SecD [Sulfuricurvum kujiense DSM 16994]|uniref:Protein translocase subunit SecD n=1 Tax=Sulfuricurvum kujiense (strain ATCC BAA-921 / DSM 16994 / JCM 11577 / YK-1) TaxID=709032 RepID=E4U018_SULKY|nr:protein translocase subunit SecD [Sulfuricurvum kujiense]ADR33183.1 protein-export membrane protein SecD [Sulfuricurvum kujiense DSM 16994]
MKLNYRVVLLIIATVFGLIFSLPSFTQSSEGKKITLGLDLQGGLHMLLGVKTEEAVNSQIKSIASGVKHFAERNDILIEGISVREGKVVFELLDGDDATTMDEHLKTIEGTVVHASEGKYAISITPEAVEKLKLQAVDQAIETIRNRLDQFGLAEPTVAKQGIDKILVELPGIKTAEEEQRARELISRAAKLELMAVDEDRSMRVNDLSEAEAASYGDRILEDALQPQMKHLVNEIPILDGTMLTDAQVGYDQNNRPVINFSLNSAGAQVFGDFTGKSVGKRLAIVLDGKVYSAPVINERIGGGSGQISGNYTVAEANDLAIALRSGALLAPIYMLEKRSVGPSLGADSIKASLLALVSGFVLVMIFMIMYYGLAGIIANLAVVINIFIILAMMALLGATLTLPGMAGIVLHIGLAVDANIIINERVREQIRLGIGLKRALHEGYSKAMRAILDSNITQIIACTILYVYGTGAIKGFAVTLSMGILASMLTAIVGTYGIFQLFTNRIEKSKNYKMWFGMTRKVNA